MPLTAEERASLGQLQPQQPLEQKATPEQVTQAWLPHVLGAVAQAGALKREFSQPASDVQQRLVAEDTQRIADIAPDPAQRKDLERKLVARDLVTVGGLFFGAPAIEGGAGVLGAAAGTVGRLAGAASVGAGLGLTEGLVGGYDKEELPTLAKDYVAGTLMLGVPLEMAGGVLALGSRFKQVRDVMRLAREALDGKMRSAEEMDAAIASSPEAAKFFDDLSAIEKAKVAGREEVKAIAKEIRRRAGYVRAREIKRDPGLRDFLFNQLKEKHPDLSPNADPAVLWKLSKDEGILPQASRPIGKKVVPVEGNAAESARSAYGATMGNPDVAGTYYSKGRVEAAKAAARKAAWFAKQGELEQLIQVGRLRNTLTDKALNPDLMGAFQYLHANAIKRVATLVQDTNLFGDAGPVFGKMLHRFSVLREATEGHWTRIIQDKVLHGLKPEDLQLLDDYLRWKKPAGNARVFGAAQRWVSFFKDVAEQTKNLKLEAKDRGLTAIFRDLKPRDKDIILKLQRLAPPEPGKEEAAQAAMDALLNKLGPEAQQFLKDVGRLGGRIDVDNGAHVIRPFQESSIKAPDYYKPELLDAMNNDENHPIIKAMFQQVLNERPELSHPVTKRPYHSAVMAEVRERLGLGGTTAPEYIWNNSLQWSREAIIDPANRISDPKIWMTKYAHAAASRHAAAIVFGPAEEHFNALRQMLVAQTARNLTGAKFEPVGAGAFKGGKFEPAPNIKLLDSIYDMAMGRGVPTAKPLKQAMDVALRQKIGFTTFLKQFSSLKNVAAAHGIANTLDAMTIVLSSPSSRVLADDLGATLADLVRVLADETQAINPENKVLAKGVQALWGKSASDQLSRTGTLIGDRFTRRVSAIAAGLKVSKAAREVRLLGSSSRAERMIGEQARRWLEHMDLDVDQIIQHGLTDAQRRQAMLSGARTTQFTSQVEDLPPLATIGLPGAKGSEQYGRAMALLNKFSYQQGPFVMTHLLKEAAQGNMKPIIGFAVFLGFSDRAMTELLKALSSSNYDVATDMMIDSMFGKFGSVAKDMKEDPARGVANVALGPIGGVITDIGRAGQETYKTGESLVQGEPGDALTHAGKVLWHLSPATLRQLIYMGQTMTGRKE